MKLRRKQQEEAEDLLLLLKEAAPVVEATEAKVEETPAAETATEEKTEE
jgi:hypothetical protein